MAQAWLGVESALSSFESETTELDDAFVQRIPFERKALEEMGYTRDEVGEIVAAQMEAELREQFHPLQRCAIDSRFDMTVYAVREDREVAVYVVIVERKCS